MKKKIVILSVLGVLMACGNNISYAGVNPFSDVPKSSWCYDAIDILVKDGIINGYNDMTFKGNKNMTRYEMAQIIAKAMTKVDMEKEDKELVDKLSLEFKDELDNLGIKISDLERKSDNILWKGKIKYKYVQENHNKGNDKHSNKLEMRLDPKAYIGLSEWTANARIKYVMYPEQDSNANTVVERAYVEGPLFNTKFSAGRTPIEIIQGVIFDDGFSGITSEFGSNVFDTKLYIGRYSEIDHDVKENENNKDITFDYYGVQFEYTPQDIFKLNGGYLILNGIDNDTLIKVEDNKANIWYVGGEYKFTDNLKLIGEFVKNTEAREYGNAYFGEIQYREADLKIPNSWQIYMGYRYFGRDVVIETGFDDVKSDQKGLVLGATYVLAENTTAELKYFKGKDISSDTNANTLYSKIEFKF